MKNDNCSMMKIKQKFEAPRILREMELSPEGLLMASVVDTGVKLETTGQKVENHDFSGSEFNHEWSE